MWQASALILQHLMHKVPQGDFRVLLVHNPDFNEILPEVRVDLALSGHTHGGQVRLPWLGAPIVPSCFGHKYAAGLVQSPRSPVYVSRGLGMANVPIRFNCRPEVTLLRLRRPQ